ncbi:hypothetical protein Q7P36_001347 [Cladosporium allicinum]
MTSPAFARFSFLLLPPTSNNQHTSDPTFARTKAEDMSSRYNNSMRGYSMDDAAMHSGIPDTNMHNSDTQDAVMRDARPSFIAAAFAGLENSASLQSMISPDDSSFFEGWMAMINNQIDVLDIKRSSVGNKRVKVPTSRQSDSDQVPLDEGEIEHAFAYAEARARVDDDSDEHLVAAVTAAFDENSSSDTASELQKHHSPSNPFYQDEMTLAWAATNIVAYFREASEMLSDWHTTQDPSTIVASTLKKTSTLNRMWANIEWTLEFLALGREGFCLLQLPDDFFAHVLPLVEDTIY